MAQQRVERGEFVVDGDAQRLERAPDRLLRVGRARRLPDDPRQRVGGVDRLRLQCSGDPARGRLVGVLFQELRQLLFAETGQEQRRRLSASAYPKGCTRLGEGERAEVLVRCRSKKNSTTGASP